MGYIGPIPASAIKSASAEYGDEAEAFHHCIRAMDAAFLNAVRPAKEGEHRIMKTPLRPDMLRGLGK